LPMSSGCRFTLTQNLYAESVSTMRLAKSMNLELSSVNYVRKIIDNKNIMSEGGKLSFYTSHTYPHTSKYFSISALKGVDRAIWQCFRTMGCKVLLRPVLTNYNENADKDLEVHACGRELSYRKGQERAIQSHYRFQYLLKEWGIDDIKYDEAEWVNGFDDKHRDKQITYMAYENQASLATEYSYCTIIVEAPKIDHQLGTGARVALDDF
ncbi:hypothetical protein QBC36DRAFT_195354, partial [Triangularia setosa]